MSATPLAVRDVGDEPTPVADDVWVVRRPLRFFGFPLGTRMTVVRMRDGGLWLHSPVPIDDALAARLGALGPVRHIVAPNRMHHLFAGPAKARHLEAALHLAPGLAAKRPDLPGAELSTDDAPWGPEIAMHRVAGLRVLGELVFFHVASRTLVLSDLAFNIGPEAPWATRMLARVLGVYGKLGCPLDVRWFFLADRRAFAASIETIAAWQPARIVLAHGELVTDDAAAAFDAAFAFTRR